MDATKSPFTVQDIARFCHQVNKAYCALLGDHSQPEWEDAPSWQRESATQGVRFHLDNPDATDSATHDNWMKEKLADGWAWGPEKDVEKKEHHCMVPFEELPKEQQIKDALFRQTVHAVKALLGT